MDIQALAELIVKEIQDLGRDIRRLSEKERQDLIDLIGDIIEHNLT